MLFTQGLQNQDWSAEPASSGMIQQLKHQFFRWLSTKERHEGVIWVCVLIVAVFFLKNLFRYLAVYFMAPVRASIIRETRSNLFKKMMELPISYFSEEKKGDLIARMTSDVQEVESTLLSTFESWVKDPLIILGSLTFMLYTSAWLTLFVLLLLLVTGFLVGGISRTLKRKSHNAQAEFSELISLQEESLGGLRVIKLFGAESFVTDRFDRILDNYRRLLIQIQRRRDLAPPTSEFLGIVIVCLLMGVGAAFVFGGTMEASTFLAFLYAFFSVIEPSKALSASYFNVQKGMAALERILYVMRLDNKMPEADHPVRISGLNREIVFEEVSFSYPNADVPVLDRVSFKIKKGQTVALVGASGSGKSTLVDLLARFHDVTGGKITIDGHDIREIKVSDLRSLMGMVTQDPILFNDTIRNNIVFGQKDATDQQVKTALNLSNSLDFVEDPSRGLDFVIGDRGVKLSGGQKQRLTIARALMFDPEILILDEATSALDSASEKLIQDALDELLSDRTAIIIAHRLSTVRKADLILVLKDGKIVESGTHDSLLQNQGEYHNFVSLQSLK
jgi:subfamily B ATP-binding cassette protein MsbA